MDHPHHAILAAEESLNDQQMSARIRSTCSVGRTLWTAQTSTWPNKMIPLLEARYAAQSQEGVLHSDIFVQVKIWSGATLGKNRSAWVSAWRYRPRAVTKRVMISESC